ncbi:DUF4810 domain-containing protein [Alteromonas gilva]|uniref:DUF4810 domain-containing protein n=1 Tax=Alteromonas gilva TaxID=2987522 RepID=A0ABT5L132_9ALTE|nr:DUF4810 domain-containing protein [Alteromonas gilva]MDC8829523.1 DUF4810 domain-containing protein [Alteromonas gilva]
MNIKILLGFAAVFLLTACESTPQRIYYHGDYAASVYHYFKSDEVTVDEQINALTIIIEKAANSGRPIAPGIHAHLGMLYFEQGDSVNGIAQFEIEKQLFPESVAYMDFLLANQGVTQ